MAGNAPFYDNIRWGGPKGLRVPQEMGPATFLVKKEVNLGTMAGTTITLDPSQAMASYITATPTANSTIVYPAVNDGLVVIIDNLASVTYTLTVEVSGNANTVSIAANTIGIIVHDGVSGGLLAVATGTSPGTFAYQVANATKDAVTFASAVNVCIFTSTGDTGGNAATLATPGASDVGKILVIVNTNTTQNVVTTGAGILRLGTGTTYLHLTAPANAGAVAILVASNGYWNVGLLGTGTWVLS